jgi:dTMP kinase
MQADFILSVSVSQLLQRGDFGEERYEKIDFQIKVREKFMKLKAEDDGRLPWFTLDARKSIEELREEIALIADKVVRESKHKSLSRLW